MTLSAQSVCKIIGHVLFREASSNHYVKLISTPLFREVKTKCKVIHFNWNNCKAIIEVRLLTYITMQKLHCLSGTFSDLARST